MTYHARNWWRRMVRRFGPAGLAVLALAGCITVQMPEQRAACEMEPPPAVPSILVYQAGEEGCAAPYATCFLPADAERLSEYMTAGRLWMWRTYFRCGGGAEGLPFQPPPEPDAAPPDDGATEGTG